MPPSHCVQQQTSQPHNCHTHTHSDERPWRHTRFFPIYLRQINMRNYKQTNKNPRPFWISVMWTNEQPNQRRTHFGVWRNSVASFLGGWIRVWGSADWEVLELFWNFSLSLFLFALESKDIIRTFEDLCSFSLSSKTDELFLQMDLHANQPYHELLLILLLPLQVLCIAWNGMMWRAFFFPPSLMMPPDGWVGSEFLLAICVVLQSEGCWIHKQQTVSDCCIRISWQTLM